MQKLISDVKEVNVRGCNSLRCKRESVGRDERRKVPLSLFAPRGFRHPYSFHLLMR